MSDNQLIDQIERYLNGEMAKEERARFEILRNENADVNDQVTEHKLFTGLVKQYGERLELERRLDAIHDEIDVNALEDELLIRPAGIVRLWRNHHSKISVAASIAIFAVLCTLFFTGYLSNRETNYRTLRAEVEGIKQKTKALDTKVNGLNPDKAARANPGKYRGTGFAITSNGYIITDFHVINNADSVYVQNVDGKSYRARVVYTEPLTDIAILQINDPSFVNLAAIPYSFKKAGSDIGENVFTLGYPGDSMVLGPGYLTAINGANDTTSYQISIPANPGHSGAPLFDNKGNVIGIIKGKQTHVEGAAYAVKANFLLKAISDIPSDSLKTPLTIDSKNTLINLTRVQQIKKLQNYIFMVKVYNQ